MGVWVTGLVWMAGCVWVDTGVCVGEYECVCGCVWRRGVYVHASQS